MRKFFIFIYCFSLCFGATAQEFRCNLSVNTSKIQGTNKSVFQTLQKDLNDFISNTAWTNNKFSTYERIECSFFLTITEQIGSNEFKGTLQIQSSRPVYGSSYITPVLNFMDNEVSFTYIEYDRIEFNEQAHLNNLSSLFAFYIYVILGLDYDTFSLRGGTEYLKKAEHIVVNAQSAIERGWRPYEGARNNRYWLIENILNHKYDAERTAYYKYHRLGLDQMNERISEGRENITEALLDIQKVYRERPDIYLFFIKVFFDAKSDEIINIYSEATSQECTRIYQVLAEVDKNNVKKYEKLKTKETAF
ncbi:MAG: DUF4835 family protein [Prevotellaceae bacterium]|jgi:hypothetical protein|nr:DUF4835 family protein [Prevotellaceae bacterium]